MAEEEDIAAEGKAEVPPRTFATNAVQMLRTSQGLTMALSQMADQKASILMGATFVVFSIAVSRGLTGTLPWSLTVLALFSFLSSMCAVIAIVPSVARPKPGSALPTNRLFFGHYTNRGEDEWADDVLKQMETEEAMFRMMLRDIYQNGQVLQRRKYRYLGYAYRLFIIGLILTLSVFIFEVGQASTAAG